MPAQRCQHDGRPGWKWGESGKCYTYTAGDEASEARAKAKALKQGRAVKVSETRHTAGDSTTMNVRLRAHRIEHMASNELLAIIPPDTVARIKQTDPTPEFRAYAIAHEGEALGNIVGLGKRVMQYFSEAVVQLHNKLQLGTKIFHRHAETNDHDGRAPIGELVGKAMQYVGGKLHDVAAVYIRPEHRALPLDVASIEAEITFTDDGQRARCVDVGDITGIALSSSAVERPGFPGATLLATVQAFVEGDGNTMTKEELKEAIAEANLKPSDVFGEDALKGDLVVMAYVKAEKQTEYEHAKRVERTLGEERQARMKKDAEHEKALAEATTKALQASSRSVLDSIASERKLTEVQRAFVDKGFGAFKTEAKDDGGLKGDLNKFVDTKMAEFAELSKMFGGSGGSGGDANGGKGTPSGDGGKGTPSGDGSEGHPLDFSDPKQNDFIPA